MATETDICILGGGIMGLATAYSISKASASRVLLLDRYGVGNDFCSSNDVNRVFRYSYGNDELYTRMAVESLKLWKDLEKGSEEEILLPTGLLMLQGEDRKANGFNESSYRTLSRMKLGAEQLEAEELKKRFPQFRAEKGFFDPHGGVLLASKVLSVLSSLIEQNGVKVRKGAARKLIFGEQPSVETTDGENVRFRKLVMTIGAWSNNLLSPKLASMVPTRQQLIYFKPHDSLARFRPKHCPVFFTDRHYGLPAAGIDGVKLSPKELSEPVDPESANRSVDKGQIAACREVCRRFVPDLSDGEVVRTKVCLYDMTENSDFVLDRDPDHPEVVYGYGFSGHGFKFAPLIGTLLCELALDKKLSLNLENFSAVPSRRRAPTVGGHLGQGE
ncbi:MAG TPA: FAD-dependent oxidoreductase [Candidatus Angelobacter sp.]|nr:FAD-dependent oxidoreductase [Candidatus Angelobacter sp.]